jgi:putative transposase
MLTLPSQSIKVTRATNTITIACLKLNLEYYFPNTFSKINQIELDDIYAYISVTIQEPQTITSTTWVGVDLNTTGHCAVMAHPDTG